MRGDLKIISTERIRTRIIIYHKILYYENINLN